MYVHSGLYFGLVGWTKYFKEILLHFISSKYWIRVSLFNVLSKNNFIKLNINLAS